MLVTAETSPLLDSPPSVTTVRQLGVGLVSATFVVEKKSSIPPGSRLKCQATATMLQRQTGLVRIVGLATSRTLHPTCSHKVSWSKQNSYCKQNGQYLLNRALESFFSGHWSVIVVFIRRILPRKLDWIVRFTHTSNVFYPYIRSFHRFISIPFILMLWGLVLWKCNDFQTSYCYNVVFVWYLNHYFPHLQMFHGSWCSNVLFPNLTSVSLFVQM